MIPENHGGGIPLSADGPVSGKTTHAICETKFHTKSKAARRPPSPYPTKPGAILRSRQWPVLEVILQNPRGQRRAHGVTLPIDRAYDFSPTNDFRAGKAGDLGRQNQIDFELRVRLQDIIGAEEHSGTADVLCSACVPLRLAKPAITQRQVKLESLRAYWRRLPRPQRGLMFDGLHGHSDLRGSWSCIEHFADHHLQVAKVEGLLEQANAFVQRAVLSDHVFR